MFVSNYNLADILAGRQKTTPVELNAVNNMLVPNRTNQPSPQMIDDYTDSVVPMPGVQAQTQNNYQPSFAAPVNTQQMFPTFDLTEAGQQERERFRRMSSMPRLRNQEDMMRAAASGDMTEYNRLAALYDPSRQAGAVKPAGNTMSVEQLEEFSKSNPISFAHSGAPAGSPVGGAAPAPTVGDVTTADIDPSQSTLSPNFANYIYNMLAKGEAAANMPFTPYMGQRFAGVSPLQGRAFQGLYGLQTPGQFGLGSSLVSQAGLGSFTAPGTASAFMSPYMQSVVDAQKREARRQADISGTQRGAKFAQAGAFGGARQALENAEAERNLQQRMGDIETQGLQSAFDRAQQQYNAERQAQIQAGLGLGSLGTQQFGAEYQGLMGQLQGGQQQRQIAQEPLDFGYQQFQESMKYPYQQATFMQSLLQGLPIAARPYDTGQSGLSAALQGGLGGLSLYNLLSGKKPS